MRGVAGTERIRQVHAAAAFERHFTGETGRRGRGSLARPIGPAIWRQSAGRWGWCFRIRTTSYFVRRCRRTWRLVRSNWGWRRGTWRRGWRERWRKWGWRVLRRRATHHLSHGEKRRVCLAGVLACEPRILVFDEPTSDLDPRGRREFKALLRQIRATKFIATHDLELAVELCARIIVLDGGQVVAEGPT